MTFRVTQKPTRPTVFNLQASDSVHCEEETGAYYQLSRFTYKLVLLLLLFYSFIIIIIINNINIIIIILLLFIINNNNNYYYFIIIFIINKFPKIYCSFFLKR